MWNRFSFATLLLGVSTILSGFAFADDPAAGDTWLQWRGPTRDGKFYGPEWPKDLSETHLKPIWNASLSESYSGPIVTKDRVITTQTKGKKNEVVLAFDRNTGDKVWEQKWAGAMKVPFFASANGSWIRSTPVCDGEILIVGGIREVLVALDCETGEEKWRVDFVEKLGTKMPSFGFASSPLIDGDFVYVQAGGGFAKLKKSDGEVVWQTAKDGGGMSGGAFSSPIIAELHGQRVILVQTRTELKAIDMETGDELASRKVKAFRGMNILTPLVHKNAVFTSAHSGQGELLRFSKAAGSGFEILPAWENRKLEAYMASPVLVGEYAYLPLKNQRFACFEIASGTEKWRTGPYGKYWSMVTQGDRILALDERGILRLIKATPEKFELISERQVSDESTWAHLAVAGNQVFVRALHGLTVYEWK